MELMLLGLFLGSPLLALLAWHAWRDKRGERRNEAGRCYACSCAMDGRAEPISHHKGGTYLYCSSCARAHNRVKSGVLLLTSLLLAAALIVMVANHFASRAP